MKADRFSRAEESYYQLKEELEAGHITPRQFDKAVRESMVVDRQGRYWRFGDDEKWYRQEGPIWLRGDPYGGGAPPAFPFLRALIQLALGGVAFVMLLGLCLVLFTTTQTTVRGAAKNTSDIIGSLSKLLPSSTGVPSLKGAETPDSGTSVPSNTPTPSGLLSTIQQLAAASIPTVTPLAGPGTPGSSTATPLAGTPGPPTVTPEATMTLQPTATLQATPTQVDTPAASGAGVYVTGMSVSPSQPLRKQPFAFTVTFLNNTGTPQAYRWVVQLYSADTLKGFGQSGVLSVTVPPGTSTFMNTYAGVKGPGGCIQLVAQPQYQVDVNARIAFTAPDGSAAGMPFSVCP